MYSRQCKPSKQHSFFLFGARGVGKTSLLHQLFNPTEAHFIDLLDSEIENILAVNPAQIENILKECEKNKKIKWLVIDEIQKVPALLDHVHRTIENSKIKFALTGSSARKLKRGHANLLAGRAIAHFLYPLTSFEIGKEFSLNNYLAFGGLPKVQSLNGRLREDFLKTYVNTYLKEEIIAEQLVRKVQPFRQFLEVAAQANTKIINYSKIARDILSDPVSVESYFQILEDTHIGHLLQPYHQSIRKRQRRSPKFYFFDPGVQRALARQITLPLTDSTYQFGDLFEQFLINEIIYRDSYAGRDWKFSYLRTKDDVEIDLIIERPGLPIALVEIKSAQRISTDDVSKLAKISKDFDNPEVFFLSRDKSAQIISGVRCLPWQKGLEELAL